MLDLLILILSSLLNVDRYNIVELVFEIEVC